MEWFFALIKGRVLRRRHRKGLSFGLVGAGLEGRSDGLASALCHGCGLWSGHYVRLPLFCFCVMVMCAHTSVSRSTQIK